VLEPNDLRDAPAPKELDTNGRARVEAALRAMQPERSCAPATTEACIATHAIVRPGDCCLRWNRAVDGGLHTVAFVATVAAAVVRDLVIASGRSGRATSSSAGPPGAVKHNEYVGLLLVGSGQAVLANPDQLP
jgi:hypothetical protein